MNALDVAVRGPTLAFHVVPQVTWIPDAELRRLAAALVLSGAACAADWNQPVPTIEVVSSAAEVPDDAIPMLLSPSIDAPGDLAYHSWMNGRPFVLVLADETQVTLQDVQQSSSHEVNEALADAPCDRWIPLPSGAEVALEICDPTEGDSIPFDIGDGPPVLTSNYVLPGWFDPSSTGQVDKKGVVAGPMQVNPLGYAVILDPNGSTRQIGQGPVARKRHPAFRHGRRLAQAHARALRVRLAARAHAGAGI